MLELFTSFYNSFKFTKHCDEHRKPEAFLTFCDNFINKK